MKSNNKNVLQPAERSLKNFTITITPLLTGLSSDIRLCCKLSVVALWHGKSVGPVVEGWDQAPLYSIAGLWSRSRRLDLETYQRVVSVSSREKLSVSSRNFTVLSRARLGW